MIDFHGKTHIELTIGKIDVYGIRPFLRESEKVFNKDRIERISETFTKLFEIGCTRNSCYGQSTNTAKILSEVMGEEIGGGEVILAAFLLKIPQRRMTKGSSSRLQIRYTDAYRNQRLYGA